jgi:hypothetical protein
MVILPIDAHAAEILDEDAAPAPLSPIRLRVTGWRRRAGGGDWASVPVPSKGLALQSKATPSGHLAVLDAIEGADGIVRQPYFDAPGDPAGAATETEIDVTVDGDVYRPTTKPVALPAHEQLTEIELRPNYRYPFRSRLLPNGTRWPSLIRGRLVDGDMTGVAGMLVNPEADGPESGYRTDSTGHFVLVLPSNEPSKSKTSIAVFRPGDMEPIATREVDVAAGEINPPIIVVTLPGGSTGD